MASKTSELFDLVLSLAKKQKITGWVQYTHGDQIWLDAHVKGAKVTVSSVHGAIRDLYYIKIEKGGQSCSSADNGTDRRAQELFCLAARENKEASERAGKQKEETFAEKIINELSMPL